MTVAGEKSYTFGFDANGNTQVENTRQYIYNQNQRLIKVTEQNGELSVTKGEYFYNGNGQRAKKVVNGQTALFFFDQHGKLIAEQGGPLADYLYLNGNPFAKTEGANLYFYHNDHLGTPQRMTGGAKQIVWAGEFMPFGQAMSISGTVTNDFRFPGQYWNEENGLYYNYFRDYNPASGRYVQTDPIGIKRGKNHLFVYVQNNPINFTDPYGLSAMPGALPIAGGFALADGPLPIGDIIGGAIIVGAGLYDLWQVYKEKYEKPENPNKPKGADDRKKCGERERNVGHPDGEEHSRVPKGPRGPFRR